MIYLTTENEKYITKRNIMWENPCDRSEMSMYKKNFSRNWSDLFDFLYCEALRKGTVRAKQF